MSETLLDFTGKSVLITGAATGIGRAVALAFGRQGGKVAIGDCDPRGQETADRIVAAGGAAFYQRTDVRKAEEVTALVEATVERFEGLHCAFNNAGILPATLPLADMPDTAFDEILAVDLLGVFLCMKYEIRHMLRAGGGAIDYARQNIRINAIAPGLVHTPMTQRWLDDPAYREVMLAHSPVGRAARPEEITGIVLYLCSNLASFATGQTFVVDGAQTAH